MKTLQEPLADLKCWWNVKCTKIRGEVERWRFEGRYEACNTDEKVRAPP